MTVGLQGISIRRIGSAIAAEVTGIDLAEVDQSQYEHLHRSFLEHSLLVIRDQDLDFDALTKFARWWGELHTLAPHVTFGVPGNRHVSLIKNMQVRALADGSKRRITEIWHADSSWDERPPTHAILHAKVLPDVGGDTLFANQCAAFHALSPAMQKMLASLRAVHRTPKYRFDEGSGTETVHPVVTTHPETGRKVLYVNLSATRQFEGMTEQESRGLLEFLFDHQVRPEFVYRHRWSLGDVVLWDNRCTLHYAVNDYEDAPRELVRVSIVGPPPKA